MASAPRMPRPPTLPHCRLFRERYRVIDDLVQYTLSNHLQEVQQNIDESSGFTLAIGKLVRKIMEQFRESLVFERKMQKIMMKCMAGPNSLVKMSTVLEQVTHFVPLLELKDDLFYFMYFAITCELCRRFEGTELDEFIGEVKESAKVALFVYWNNGSRCDQLDSYAQVLVNGPERNFCEGKHYDVVKRFLLR